MGLWALKSFHEIISIPWSSLPLCSQIPPQVLAKNAETLGMKNLPWFSHFKALLQGFEIENRKDTPEYPLIAQALRENYIPEADYFQWAKNHFKIPILTDDFFKSPVSNHYWPHVKASYPWSSYILPVGEWDQHIIVACLEVPENFPDHLKPIFVLCSRKSMDYHWNNINPAEDKTLVVADTSSGTKTTSVAPSPQIQNTEFKLELNGSLELSDTENESSEDQPLDALSEDLNSGPPTGLFDNENAEKTGASSLESIEIPEFLNPSEVPAVTFVATEAPTSQSVIAQPAVAKVVTPAEKTKQEPHLSVVQGHAQAPSSKQMILNLLFQKNKVQFDKEIKSAFDKMHSHFPKSMLLSLDIEESSLKPYLWTSEFKPGSDNIQPIDLSVASLFKIVSVSHKPYHGFIVLNDVNERFFEEWNQGALPDHATATPILINNKLAGILIGIGEKSNYTWATLQLMENLTNELNQKLSSLVDTAA